MELNYTDPENYPEWLRLTGLSRAKHTVAPKIMYGNQPVTLIGHGQEKSFVSMNAAAEWMSTQCRLKIQTCYIYIADEPWRLKKHGWQCIKDSVDD